MLAAEIQFYGRTGWTLSSTWWNWLLDTFLDQYDDEGSIRYFPQWLERWANFVAQPTLTIQPDSSGVLPHWQDWTKPVYEADPADPGLRWNLVRYEDGV